MQNKLDEIRIQDLLVRGILGINEEERQKKQDIIICATLWANTFVAEKSDNINMAINYKDVAKAIISHVENNEPFLVEKLCGDLAKLCFRLDARIKKARISVEKPTALRFTRSVGVSIKRSRKDYEL